MKNKSTFAPISKKEWLAKIEKDNKREPNSYDWSLGDLSFSAFYHQEDAIKVGEKTSSNDQIAKPLLCTYKIIGTGDDINKTLLNELEGGVQVLFIEIMSSADEQEFTSAFQGVYLDLIEIHVHTNDRWKHWVRMFYDLCRDSNTDTSKIKGSFFPKNRTLDSDELHYLKTHFPAFETGRLTTQYPKNEQEEIDQLTSVLFQLHRTIEKTNSTLDHLLGEISFHLFYGRNYFLNASKVRILELVLSNYAHATGQVFANRPRVFAHLILDQTLQDPNQRLIMQSVQVTAIGPSLPYGIVIPPANMLEDGLNDKRYLKYSRNIYHLLDLESKAILQDDPTEGSYFYDNVVYSAGQNVWDDFIKKL